MPTTSHQIRVHDRRNGLTHDHRFSAPVIRIGRDPTCELQLADPFVSAQHALLEADEHGVRLRDLGAPTACATPAAASPVVDDIAQQLCRQADILTPNETEFAHLLRVAHGLDIDASTLSSQSDAALHAWCRAISDATVVITLGAHGAFVSHPDSNRRGDAVACYRVKPCAVNAIDTTGAGDAFSGALAAALVSAPDLPFAQVVAQASKVAALSTECAGDALAIPRAAEVAARFG